MSSMIPANSKCLVVGATNPSSIGFCVALSLLKAGASHVTIMGRDPTKVDAAVVLLARTLDDGGDGGGGGRQAGGVVGDLKRPETSTNQHGGTVVVVGSVSANVAWPDTAPHNFAMAAKNTMIQTLAFKYRHDRVRVNGVQCGVIHTGALDVMAKKKKTSVASYAALRASAQPLGRNGTPEDVAQAVLYLASPASGFTLGELLRVDGGLHLSNWWNRQAMLNEYGGAKTQTK
eukprot:CAMPEP_0194305198 /NCGR_PEP_ID=MMETSP0171-20130528/2688_1 /TAXON_ID=218684 /ORGANISM="Corethron pennatum, Strain L29A3" /LENGTH=231 /DNA_ID=CAMNT_0039056651 /DNA_START=32 /DNA_END=728 /DNA_ORIENTATION=+